MNQDLKFVWKKLTQYKKYLIVIGFSGLIYSASKALIAHFVKQLMDTATVPENMKTEKVEALCRFNLKCTIPVVFFFIYFAFNTSI